MSKGHLIRRSLAAFVAGAIGLVILPCLASAHAPPLCALLSRSVFERWISAEAAASEA